MPSIMGISKHARRRAQLVRDNSVYGFNRGQIIASARSRGMWVMFGKILTFFDKETGRQLISWKPQSGYWSTGNDNGNEKDWKKILKIAAIRRDRWKDRASGSANITEDRVVCTDAETNRPVHPIKSDYDTNRVLSSGMTRQSAGNREVGQVGLSAEQ